MTRKQKVQRTIQVLSWVLAIFWLGFAATSMVYVIAAGRSPTGPELFGYRFMAVESDSMTPLFKAGDMVVGRRVDPMQVQVGEIITYMSNSAQRLVTHRVLEISTVGGERVFLTKGDANGAADTTPVSARYLIASYSFRLPYFGYLVVFARSWVGLVVFVIVPCLILMGSEGTRIARLLKSGERAQPEKS